MGRPFRCCGRGDLWIAAGGMLAGAAAAGAQPGWTIQFVFAPGQTQVSPRTPSCTVRLWARFAGPYDYAMAGMRWDVLAGDGEWSRHRLVPPLNTGAHPGIIDGPKVTGIIAGQLHFPPGGMFADPSNPILAWEATWTTTDFTRRSVPFKTRTTRFDVYCEPPWRCGTSPSRLHRLVEGEAELPVAPCACDCDTGTGPGVCDLFDFLCFQNRFDASDPYACDRDTGTGRGVCDLLDFLCFQAAFAAGCP